MIENAVYFDHHFESDINLAVDRLKTSAYDIEKARNTALTISHYCSFLGKTVLDIGCGVGYFLDTVRTQGATVFGLDASSRTVAMADQLFGINVIRGWFPEDFIGSSYSVDIVTFNDLFEHLESPREALDLARRWLRPKGTLVIRTPNIARVDRQKAAAWRLLQPQDHLFYYSQPTLRQLLVSSGFEVIEVIENEWLLAIARCGGPTVV